MAFVGVDLSERLGGSWRDGDVRSNYCQRRSHPNGRTGSSPDDKPPAPVHRTSSSPGFSRTPRSRRRKRPAPPGPRAEAGAFQPCRRGCSHWNPWALGAERGGGLSIARERPPHRPTLRASLPPISSGRGQAPIVEHVPGRRRVRGNPQPIKVSQKYAPAYVAHGVPWAWGTILNRPVSWVSDGMFCLCRQ